MLVIYHQKIPGYVFLKSVDDDFNLLMSIEIPFISLVSKSNFTNPSKDDDELIISRSLKSNSVLITFKIQD